MAYKIPGKRSKNWKGYRVQSNARKIGAQVTVYRTPQVGAAGNFLACAQIGKGRKMKQHMTFRVIPGAAKEAAFRACANGRNPRRAIGLAFAKLGRALSKRAGGFAGL